MNNAFAVTVGLAAFALLYIATAEIEQEGAPVPSLPAPVPSIEASGVNG